MRHLLLVVVVLGAIACGGGDDPPGPGADAGADGSSAACTSDESCDDALFCNGAERCVSGSCAEGAPPCGADAACDEDADACETCGARDADGDGVLSVACGGSDCDDEDPARYPGATEVCDLADVDEDCDPRTFGVRDLDSDGAPDALCCNPQPDGTDLCGSDCDDTRAGSSPDATETCNGRDDDCDGAVDEELTVTLYLDADGDLHGTPEDSRVGCPGIVPMYVEAGGDCDDADAAIHPSAGESCTSAADDDCDGTIDEGCICTPGETRPCGLLGLCESGVETCADGTFWSACSIEPAAADVCDGLDEDCDGSIDEGVSVLCYPDGDNDTYAVLGAAAVRQCPDELRPEVGRCPTSSTDREPASPETADCCDSDARAHPGQTSYFSTARACGGFDFDCDGGHERRWTVEESSPCVSAGSSGACDRRDDQYRASPVWVSAEPSCGLSGELVDRCTWISTGIGGACSPSPRSQDQACR